MAKKNALKIDIIDILRRYRGVLETAGIKVKKIILYGSYARGNPHKDSDIDVCIITNSFQDRFDGMDYLLKKRREIDLRIEPVCYREDQFRDELPLVWEIKQHGIELN